MVNHRKTTKVEKHGKYVVARHPKGGFTVYGDELRDRGFYVPPDSYLIAQSRKLREIKGKLSKVGLSKQALKKLESIRTMISWRAVLDYGVRSLVNGQESLGLSQKLVTRTEKVDLIKKIWPEREIKDYYEGNRDSLPPVSDLIAADYRIYHSIARIGGLKKLIEEVYFPGKYPELYYEICHGHASINPDKINIKELGSTLFRRFCQGLTIQRTELLRSPLRKERNIARKVIALAKGNLIKGEDDEDSDRKKIAELRNHRDANHRIKKLKGIRTYTGVVEKLTGLKRGDISLGQHVRMDYAQLTEHMTHFLLLWSFITEASLSPYAEPGKIYPSQAFREFYYNGQLGRADLRIDSGGKTQAVEVKTGISIGTNQILEEIIEKYRPGKTKWKTGDKIDKVLVVLHENPKRCVDAVSKLEEAGLLEVSQEPHPL